MPVTGDLVGGALTPGEPCKPCSLPPALIFCPGLRLRCACCMACMRRALLAAERPGRDMRLRYRRPTVPMLPLPSTCLQLACGLDDRGGALMGIVVPGTLRIAGPGVLVGTPGGAPGELPGGVFTGRLPGILRTGTFLGPPNWDAPARRGSRRASSMAALRRCWVRAFRALARRAVYSFSTSASVMPGLYEPNTDSHRRLGVRGEPDKPGEPGDPAGSVPYTGLALLA